MKKSILFLVALSMASCHAQYDAFLLASQKQFENETPVDPIVEIGGLVAYWAGEDLPGTTNGQVITSWVDRVSGKVLTPIGSPTLELVNGYRAANFTTTNAFKVPEWAAVDFGQNDEFTMIVKIGNNTGTSGTFIGKAENGANPIHYQLQSNDISNGRMGVNANRSTGFGSGGFNSWNSSGVTAAGNPITTKMVLTVALGAGANDAVAYQNNNVMIKDNTAGDVRGTYIGNEDIYIGARGNGSGGIGFSYNGSLSNVLIFNKKRRPKWPLWWQT